MNILEEANEIFDNIQRVAPVVHNISNYITATDCANMTLACGGSPTMADDPEEVADISAGCNGCVINMGNTGGFLEESMLRMGRKNNELEHPVIFDPVGAGAAHRRNAVLENLMDHIRFTVIRGNISEIKYVGDKSSHAKGVDAANEDLANEDNIYEIAEYAKKISAITCSVIAISGPIDVVANADTAYLIRNGHPMMSRITGTGCMLSSAIGVFVSANPYKALEATVTAMAAYGYAGELAYEKTVRTEGGTGSLRTFLIDYMSNMNYETFLKGAKYNNERMKFIMSYPLKKEDLTLYAITDRYWLNGNKLADVVENVLKNGATFLQLREKEFSHEEMVQEAKEIKEIAARYHVPFVINDDIYAAKEINADGVHIGQSDMEYQKAREILGPDKIIGVSAGNLEQAVAAEKAGADYIGVGAVFTTSTKLDHTRITFETLKEITSTVSIPVVAIGGISADNLTQLKGTGIDGISVISAIFGQPDPGAATKDLLHRTKEMLS